MLDELHLLTIDGAVIGTGGSRIQDPHQRRDLEYVFLKIKVALPERAR
jgi:hypothetical protein